MSFHYNSSKPCIKYISHCAQSRTNSNCTFCGIDTSNFSKDDWNTSCEEAIRTGIILDHNYQIANIQGMSIREQDYVQIIYYRCTNCNDIYVERDDQR